MNIWTVEDYHARRCEANEVGALRPAVAEVELLPLDRSPEAMQRVGIDALMRLAAQDNAPRVALEAALALLDRSMGPVPRPAVLPPPPGPPTPDPEALPFPDWAQRPAPGHLLPQPEDEN